MKLKVGFTGQQPGLFTGIFVLVSLGFVFVLVAAVILRLLHVPEVPVLYSDILTTQFLQSLAMFVVPPWVYARLFVAQKPAGYLQLNKTPYLSHFLLVVVLLLLAIPGVNLIKLCNEMMVYGSGDSNWKHWVVDTEQRVQALSNIILQVHQPLCLLLNVVVVALLPAIGEELFFRGALLTMLKQKMPGWVAVWVSAFVFSAIHLQFLGFFPRLFLGALFGFIVLWSGNLWLSIAAHFLNNALAVVFVYMRSNGYSFVDMDNIGTSGTLWLGIVSVVVLIVFLILVRIKSIFCVWK